MGKVFVVKYRETTYGIKGGMIDNDVHIRTEKVQDVLDTINVACCGFSKKSQITLDIIEETDVQQGTDSTS